MERQSAGKISRFILRKILRDFMPEILKKIKIKSELNGDIKTKKFLEGILRHRKIRNFLCNKIERNTLSSEWRLA